MSLQKSPVYTVILAGCLLLCSTIVNAQDKDKKITSVPPVPPKEWVEDYEPFCIAGNLFYVGTYDLASYLIVTPEGNILINTGTVESVPLIKAHIAKLGLGYKDIKILLATHAHFDHVGGMAEIKKETGAQMMIEAEDAQVLADGGKSDFIFQGKVATFDPVKPDRILHNLDTISLGGTKLTILHHPGHTKGASSFLFDVRDGRGWYKVLIANMPSILDETDLHGMKTYPNVGKDYRYTLDTMKKIRFDIFLASHASQFGLHEKHKPGDNYNPAAFIDQKGYDEALEKLHQKYIDRLKEK